MTTDQLSYLTDCGALAVTAEMVGAGEAILDLTSDYAKQRIQFGKPIGQYQGVKHRLADMYVDLELSFSMLFRRLVCRRRSPRIGASSVSG